MYKIDKTEPTNVKCVKHVDDHCLHSDHIGRCLVCKSTHYPSPETGLCVNVDSAILSENTACKVWSSI